MAGAIGVSQGNSSQVASSSHATSAFGIQSPWSQMGGCAISGQLDQPFVPPPPMCPPPESPRNDSKIEVSHTPEGTPIPPLPPPLAPPLLESEFGPITKEMTGAAVRSEWSVWASESPERLEKYIPPLPVMLLTGVDASTRVSDWVALSTPIISSLSPSTGQWWRFVVEDAQRAYAKWLVTSPTQRLGMEPDREGKRYRTGKFSLLEPRALSLLLVALPESVRQDVLNSKSMSCTAVLFKTLCKVQPGSALDKSTMLSYIVNPPVASSPQAALDSIRKWVRTCRRTIEIHAKLPDPSLQLAGLDKISQGVMASMPAILFRVNIFREQRRLDYQPSQEGVDELAQLLLGELEMVTMHAPGNESSQRPPKHPRVAKVVAPDPVTVPDIRDGKGKGKGSRQESVSPKRGGKSKKLCHAFGVAEGGCTYGSKCRFVHDPELAKQERLCFKCGAKGHMSDVCPVEAKAKGNASSAIQEMAAPSAKAKPKGKAKAKAEARKLQEAQEDAGHLNAMGSSPSAVSEALAEATKVLKSIQMSAVQAEPQLRVLRKLSPTSEFGLVDGGASHPLRKAKPGEWEKGIPISVKLAVGPRWGLRMLSTGTLVTKEEVQPTVPLGQLVRTIRHSSRGQLPVVLHNDCPELPLALTLELIAELEQAFVAETQK